jgi:hypothetical protein
MYKSIPHTVYHPTHRLSCFQYTYYTVMAMYMIMELISNYLVISRGPYVVLMPILLSRLWYSRNSRKSLLWKLQFLFAVCPPVGKAEFRGFRTAVVSVSCETACWGSANCKGGLRFC